MQEDGCPVKVYLGDDGPVEKMHSGRERSKADRLCVVRSVMFTVGREPWCVFLLSWAALSLPLTAKTIFFQRWFPIGANALLRARTISGAN